MSAPRFGTAMRIASTASATLLIAAMAVSGTRAVAPTSKLTVGEALRDAPTFDSIRDPARRSVALFQEAGKVITHPRCMNCHPATRHPTQGENMHPHQPPISAAEGMGVPGLVCSTCHGPDNVATHEAGIQTVPGDPHWSLAPESMAWQGRTLGQICEQIKDPARNGNRTLAVIHHHMAEDHLVGWAWRPGAGRQPAPGTQAAFGRLIGAWIETGAHCPAS